MRSLARSWRARSTESKVRCSSTSPTARASCAASSTRAALPRRGRSRACFTAHLCASTTRRAPSRWSGRNSGSRELATERDESMTPHWQDWPPQVLAALRKGVVIPAHPLALDANRKLDTRRQRALTRYYLDAGAGGLAVGVHTTQFAIREAALFEPVLELAMRSAAEWTRAPQIMIAGLVGRTAQAVKEAQIARALGYHAGLLSLAALKGASEDELIAHAQTVARELPLVGSPPLAASCCRCRSGGASRRSRMWSPSRSRRSTVTARSTSCAALSRRMPPTASRSTPATTITSSSTSSPPSPWRRMAARAPCASRAGCSAIGACGSSGRSS